MRGDAEVQVINNNLGGGGGGGGGGGSRTVSEVLCDYANISPRAAKRICDDFTSAGIPCPHDGPAYLYVDIIQHIACEALEDSSIRAALLHEDGDGGNGDGVAGYELADTGDPFYYATKVSVDAVDEHLCKANSKYFCTICSSDMTGDNYRLSCGCSAFCRDCIIPWITEACGRCPNCREFCKPVVAPVRVRAIPRLPMPKPKILIQIKKKDT